MGPFLKTLFGDARNVAVVAALLAIEAALVRTGHGREATLLMPLATMAGVAWLAPSTCWTGVAIARDQDSVVVVMPKRRRQ